ncbi:hypothetical protein CKM354_001298700 [Cercospora kikuchii]|uniref:Uncharacterized protein n=1 Tax=Cercospora kikuchii TaxID=84275 RepID=A0A9P3FN03_9PEZI|nr:uncharacterized protein CKM354_001298700 [Cercospora kikuchii]GIZ49972.1 hypothetical protein CKM354_001298700 [Cercospora kikuchii]
MAQILGDSSCTIEANINYYNEPPPGERPPPVYVGTVGGRRQKWNTQPMRVTDLRTVDGHFTIHQNGFQFVSFRSMNGANYDRFATDEEIKARVYPDVKDTLKRVAGATDVFIFNHIVRKDLYVEASKIKEEVPDETQDYSQGPAMLAHVDVSYRGAQSFLDGLNKPLKTVNRDPLAVCDASTVPESDLRPVEESIELRCLVFYNERARL